jgi:predicted nucleic acid-binding Zn ribbon protein
VREEDRRVKARRQSEAPVAGERESVGPEQVGKLVERFLEGRGVAEQVRRQGVLEEWPGLVGDAIAAVTRARSISAGALFVEVRSSPWLMELEMMKGEILRRVNAGREDARIERIVFVLGEQR